MISEPQIYMSNQFKRELANLYHLTMTCKNTKIWVHQKLATNLLIKNLSPYKLHLTKNLHFIGF